MLLALGERQVAARHGRRKAWVHAASVAEPPDTRPGTTRPPRPPRPRSSAHERSPPRTAPDPRRHATVGRPGDGICPRYSCTSRCRSLIVAIANTSIIEVLRRPVESALSAAIAVSDQARSWPAQAVGHLERVEDELGAQVRRDRQPTIVRLKKSRMNAKWTKPFQVRR